MHVRFGVITGPSHVTRKSGCIVHYVPMADIAKNSLIGGPSEFQLRQEFSPLFGRLERLVFEITTIEERWSF